MTHDGVNYVVFYKLREIDRNSSRHIRPWAKFWRQKSYPLQNYMVNVEPIFYCSVDNAQIDYGECQVLKYNL